MPFPETLQLNEPFSWVVLQNITSFTYQPQEELVAVVVLYLGLGKGQMNFPGD